eukprot:669847-Lingulodinium_polyedra.AAC.1
MEEVGTVREANKQHPDVLQMVGVREDLPHPPLQGVVAHTCCALCGHNPFAQVLECRIST